MSRDKHPHLSFSIPDAISFDPHSIPYQNFEIGHFPFFKLLNKPLLRKSGQTTNTKSLRIFLIFELFYESFRK